MKKFWNWIKNSDDTRILRLEGPIDEESFWGDEITPQMFRDELESGEGDVTVWINSPGGNVFAAAEIYTMLKDYKGSITVKIDAIAASAASVVAMAGDTVQTVTSPSPDSSSSRNICGVISSPQRIRKKTPTVNRARAKKEAVPEGYGRAPFLQPSDGSNRPEPSGCETGRCGPETH